MRLMWVVRGTGNCAAYALLAQLQGSVCGGEVVGGPANAEGAEVLSIAVALRKRMAALSRKLVNDAAGTIPDIVKKVSVVQAEEWWLSAW